GVLMGAGDENDPVWKARLSLFTQALADLGWTDGRNVSITLRSGDSDTNRIRALAQELVSLQPDIILASSTVATATLQRETRTIPSPAASWRGLTARMRTSPASPTWKPRWEASGLSFSRRSLPGSSGRPSCSILTPPPHRLTCPHLRRRPSHSKSCQSMRTFT